MTRITGADMRPSGRRLGKADADPIALADVAIGDGGFVIVDDVGALWGKSDGDEVHLTDVASGVGGLSLEPATLDESFGISLSVVGDIDNSGLPELVVGAYDADHTFPEAGRAYVWLDIGAARR